MNEENQEEKLPETESRSSSVDLSKFAKLSGFQRDLLTLVAGMSTPKGLEIKEELEAYYEENINHGRLYPNLDTLAEKNLIEKISIDDRSNGYILTELGRNQLGGRRHWENKYISNIDATNLVSTQTEHAAVGSTSSDSDTPQKSNTETGGSNIMGKIEGEVDEQDGSDDDLE